MMFVIELIIFTYLTGCVLFNFFFSVAGRLVKKKKSDYNHPAEYNRIAILVPAYKEDGIILSAVKTYEQLNYPKGYYEVVVIADSLQPETMEQLYASGAKVIPVSFEKSTKAKSLNVAFGQLDERAYDLALICDADNILERDFLLKVNHASLQGKKVLQAQRVAKNMDTPFAILDAANEIIQNHINRKGHNAVGLSASFIGSGMVFPFAFVKSVLKEIQAIGGFDKVLQTMVPERGYRIHYLEEALIFDEKVENQQAFSNQRRRWVSAQLVYLRKFFPRGLRALLKGNFDTFNMAVGHNLLVPRTLLLVALVVITLLCLALGTPLAYGWVAVTVAFLVSLLLPLPAKFFTRYFLTAIMALPKVLGIMLGLLFKMKGANNTFIHTKHSKTGVDNPLINGSSE